VPYTQFQGYVGSVFWKATYATDAVVQLPCGTRHSRGASLEEVTPIPARQTQKIFAIGSRHSDDLPSVGTVTHPN
jgi:hypothetical protein